MKLLGMSASEENTDQWIYEVEANPAEQGDILRFFGDHSGDEPQVKLSALPKKKRVQKAKPKKKRGPYKKRKEETAGPVTSSESEKEYMARMRKEEGKDKSLVPDEEA